MPTKDTYFTDKQIDLARFAKALGHPVRIAILELLSSQACCYHGDMAEELPIAKSTLSQHLNELKDAGLIQGTITPPTVKYCINRDNYALAKSLLNNLLKQLKYSDPVVQNAKPPFTTRKKPSNN
jgi:predicted transcriptional regulator